MEDLDDLTTIYYHLFLPLALENTLISEAFQGFGQTHFFSEEGEERKYRRKGKEKGEEKEEGREGEERKKIKV